MPSNIQSKEYSMGGGIEDILYSTFDDNANACNVWWNDANRKSNLNWQSNFGDDNDWFAFRNSLHFSPYSLWGEFCFAS